MYNVAAGWRLTPARCFQQPIDTEGCFWASPTPILQVVFDTPLRRCFDYLPAAGERVPLPGERVRVPLGKRRAIGLVAAHAMKARCRARA